MSSMRIAVGLLMYLPCAAIVAVAIIQERTIVDSVNFPTTVVTGGIEVNVGQDIIDVEQAFREAFNFTGEFVSNALCVVQEQYVVYRLVTPESYESANTPYHEIRVGEQEMLAETTFDLNRPTEIFAHGWLQDGMTYLQSAADAYFGRGNLNVNLFVMDWGHFSKCEYVYEATIVVPAIGNVTAKFVQGLQEYGMDINSLHLTGFSFGAQHAGFAAKNLQRKPRRINGLDPAGPVYNTNPPEERLNPNDAAFVSVIHTNSRLVGTSVESGHVDWYPNGGYTQPGCLLTDVCSHLRAPQLYFESIYTTTGFIGTECNSYSQWKQGSCNGNQQRVMGYYTPEDTRGRYYLDTNPSPPYAMGP